MFLERISIFDNANKKANSFEFSRGTNLICSKKNTSGKSCLLKSIYYAQDRYEEAAMWAVKAATFGK